MHRVISTCLSRLGLVLAVILINVVERVACIHTIVQDTVEQTASDLEDKHKMGIRMKITV